MVCHDNGLNWLEIQSYATATDFTLFDLFAGQAARDHWTMKGHCQEWALPDCLTGWYHENMGHETRQAVAEGPPRFIRHVSAFDNIWYHSIIMEPCWTIGPFWYVLICSDMFWAIVHLLGEAMTAYCRTADPVGMDQQLPCIHVLKTVDKRNVCVGGGSGKSLG